MGIEAPKVRILKLDVVSNVFKNKISKEEKRQRITQYSFQNFKLKAPYYISKDPLK